MKRHILLLVSLFIGLIAQAQSKKELIELGDAAFQKENYGSAVYFYKRIVEHIPGKYDLTYPYEIVSASRSVKKEKSDSTAKVDASDAKKVYVIHRLAESYRLLRDYDNAELWYKTAMENPSPQFPNAKYYYASCLMHNDKYEEAQSYFEAFLNETGDEKMKQLTENKIASCAFARNEENRRNDIFIHKLDSTFNSGVASFGVNFFTDESLIFANAKSGNTVLDPKKDDGKYTSDLFIVSQKDSASWDQPLPFASPVNSEMNEGGSVLSVDRSTFYFTRWNPENRKECYIYVSKRFNKRWMEPLKLDINMEGYKTMMPMLNMDETKLFFASDRPGGQGGLDIWYCPVDADGILGDPVNLGPVVNTAEDETTPYYHLLTNTLYFSSTGHRGFGGLDVFKTQFVEDEGIWSTPINMGAPINSNKDDRYFILAPDQKRGYYASDREKCSSCDSSEVISGNCEKLYGFVKGTIEIDIQGYVYDAATEEPIPGAIVELKDVNGEWEPIVLITDENGFYKTGLNVGMEIFMKGKKTKYFADAASVNTTGITETTHLQQDFYLRLIPTGEIEIPGIEYDFDKATLRPKSKEILDQLYDFLVLNNDLVVEIKSHTDCRGNDNYNLKLSKDRAKSCVDYLISKGIAKERLIPQGYGETEPLFKCDDIEAEQNADKKEEMHQRNRRTAFRVVKQE
ncbi:MAG: OmpA family protein [Flavobacteriales bacterium]|nr:OmpA family protein [Flavobacteriales bacterium]